MAATYPVVAVRNAIAGVRRPGCLAVGPGKTGKARARRYAVRRCLDPAAVRDRAWTASPPEFKMPLARNVIVRTLVDLTEGGR